MRTPEITKQNSRLDLTLGLIGEKVVNQIIGRVIYKEQETIRKINESLGKGDSVLLVSDHPNEKTTPETAGIAPRYLTNRKISGVFIKEISATGKLNLKQRLLSFKQRIIIDTLARYKAESLVVKTPKHEHDIEARTSFNSLPASRGREILKTPSGVVLTFAFGTRSWKMLKTLKGLGALSPNADWTVPMTTITDNGNRSEIIVHEPIPGRLGTKWCVRQFGIKNGSQAFSDCIMSTIAVGQPDEEKRGFYREHAEYLERYMRNPTGIIPQSENLRVRRMIETYIAWRSGEFRK